MTKTRKWIVFGVALLALVMINGGFYGALADHDEHKEKRQYQKRYRNNSKNYKKRYLTPVNNPIYIEQCGACHFTYQPGLLPSGSWDKILAGLEDHFGEVIELDLASKKVIAEYLKANAAEYSSAKLAAKILRSIGGQTPLRISQIPYIQRKHHEIRSDVFKRESIGSPS
ncbi:MAG: diheme cytochrome c, partial [Methanosarcinaceae archaeon]|nr:diheme cytochrome c [Methanosarcinaceae archaeon]